MFLHKILQEKAMVPSILKAGELKSRYAQCQSRVPASNFKCTLRIPPQNAGVQITLITDRSHVFTIPSTTVKTTALPQSPVFVSS